MPKLAIALRVILENIDVEVGSAKINNNQLLHYMKLPDPFWPDNYYLAFSVRSKGASQPFKGMPKSSGRNPITLNEQDMDRAMWRIFHKGANIQYVENVRDCKNLQPKIKETARFILKSAGTSSCFASFFNPSKIEREQTKINPLKDIKNPRSFHRLLPVYIDNKRAKFSVDVEDDTSSALKTMAHQLSIV